MIDDVVGPHLARPLLCLRPRRSGNDAEAGELFGELNQDGTDAAGPSDDDERLAIAAALFKGKTVKEHFPCGDARQRQRCRIAKVECRGFATHNAFIDQVQFGIGPRAIDIAGIKDLIARSKQRDLGADRTDNAGGVKPEDSMAALGFRQRAYLDVDRVDRYSLDLHQQIAGFGRRLGEFDILQRKFVVYGETFLISYSSHLVYPFLSGDVLPQTPSVEKRVLPIHAMSKSNRQSESPKPYPLGKSASRPLLDTDLISLRALVAIADEGSFSAAAKRIGRTQSAVSLQIAKLEDRLQARLLERSSRSVEPTVAGETLIAYARRILSLADEAVQSISALHAGEPLRIGFADHLVPQHLHALLTRFRDAHPQVALELRLGCGSELIEALGQGELNLVVAGPEGDGGHVLAHEPLVWVASPNYRLDFAKPVPLVLLQPPCTYRQAAFAALATADASWSVSIEANSIQGILSAVEAGLGISVMARSAADPELIRQDVSMPNLPQTAIVAYARSKDAHHLIEPFLAMLHEELTPRTRAVSQSTGVQWQ